MGADGCQQTRDFGRKALQDSMRSTMRYPIAPVVFIAAFSLFSCARKQDNDAAKTTAEAPASAPAQPAQPASGPHAFVHLKDGSKVPGVVVASSQTDMVLDGDDGIERKIPLAQVQSVEYGEAAKPEPSRLLPRPATQPKPASPQTAAAPQQTPQPAPAETAQAPAAAPAPPPPPPPPPPARVYELPAGSEISVRTNEPIDSGTAADGQTFDAQVTRSVKDAGGAVVLPRGAPARIVIRSASKGGIRGASDLVLDLQSVRINGRSYTIDTADLSQKGKSGVGANKRTATFTGGGAALGAIIGAIAGGGKGAAIGAGSGAGAGALTQILTKGGAIKVPAESVLTFSLDKPLTVTAEE